MPVDLETKSGITCMYQEYFKKIYNYVYYRVHDHDICGDIVSGIFLKVLEHAHDFDSRKASFATWIYTIARHSVIDYYKSVKPVGGIEDVLDTLACSLDFEDAYRLYTEEQNGEVEALIGMLNETERRVIYLRYFQGCSGRETAEKLLLNPSTERTLHERALKKMLRYLREQGVTLADLV